MRNFLRRSAIAAALAAAIMGGFSSVDAVAHADVVQHCTGAIKGQTICWTKIVIDQDDLATPCNGDHPSPFCDLRQQGSEP